jgi:HEAT repeat protein
MREILGRVLGEVASPSLGAELIGLADDDLPELRAAAARAICQAQPDHALEVLAELSEDTIWFVRLRAIVAMGKLYNAKALPHLVRATTDSNRLVRMRAAEALVDFKSELVAVFAQVVETHDRYGLHAFLAALENADLRRRLEAELQKAVAFPHDEAEQLLSILSTGKLLDTPVAAPLAETAKTNARR